MTAAKKQPLNRRQWVLAALAEYEARLTRYAMRLLRDEQAAQDAVQHAFLRLCDETPEGLNGRLAPWLFKVCRNKAIDLARAKGKLESLDALAHTNGHAEHDQNGLPLACGFASREPDPADLAESGELNELLRQLIDALPESQREALDLWAEGFSHRQIGEITNKSEGNVRILVHRALTKLRSQPQAKSWLDDGRVAPASSRAPAHH